MDAAVRPLWAPSTGVTRGSRRASARASVRKAENSCVVFDIPTESSTIRPLASAFPAASRGAIAEAAWSPSFSCAAGRVFPPGYRETSRPL